MKKLFLILIMLVTSLIAKPSNNGDIDKTKENIIQNTYAEEQVISLENTTAEKEIVSQPQEEIENTEIEKDEEIIQEIEEPVLSKTESNNISVNTPIEQPIVEEKQEIIPEPAPQVEEQPEEIQPPKTENKPKQEEKIYCVDGGKTHIYGDGANEHGYYKTWDEAFNAYENYTKGWESTQFKIDQCACGLYYFWVIK